MLTLSAPRKPSVRTEYFRDALKVKILEIYRPFFWTRAPQLAFSIASWGAWTDPRFPPPLIPPIREGYGVIRGGIRGQSVAKSLNPRPRFYRRADPRSPPLIPCSALCSPYLRFPHSNGSNTFFSLAVTSQLQPPPGMTCNAKPQWNTAGALTLDPPPLIPPPIRGGYWGIRAGIRGQSVARSLNPRPRFYRRADPRFPPSSPLLFRQSVAISLNTRPRFYKAL